jgi:hypothetical protein
VLTHVPTNLPSPDVDPLEQPADLRRTQRTAVEAAFARATVEVATVPPMPRWREQSRREGCDPLLHGGSSGDGVARWGSAERLRRGGGSGRLRMGF